MTAHQGFQGYALTGSAFAVALCVAVGVEQVTNHFLVPGVMLAGFLFEEFDTAAAECDRDLDGVIPGSQLIGWRQKILDDLWRADIYVSVTGFLLHKPVYPCASKRRRIFVSCRFAR